MDIESLAPMSNPRFFKKGESSSLYTPSPTLRLMTQYGDIFRSMDNLFAKIKQLTYMNETDEMRDNTSNLKKMSYRIFAFRQIKQEANFTLQQLAKLHSFIANVYTISYLEYAGKVTKDVMDAWDKFFFGISIMEKKRNKRLRIFYELASATTRNCSKLLEEVKQKLYVKLVTCILKSNDEFKSNIKKCRKVFKLDSLRFEERFLRSDKEESFLVGRLLAKKLQVSKSQSSSSGIDSQAQLGKLNEGKNGQVDELVMDEEHAWKDLHNEYSECSISNELEADQSQSSSSSTDCPKRLGDLGQGKKRRTNGLEEDERSTEKNLRTECPDCFIPSKSQPGKSQASSSSTDCPKRHEMLGQGRKRRRDGFEECERNAEKKFRSECFERSAPGKSKAGQSLSSSLITDCLKQLDRLRQGGRKRQRDESADDEKLKRKKISKECNILSESYVGQSESSSCDTSYPIRLEVNRKITRVNSLQLHSQCSGLNKLQICTSTDCLRIGSLGRGRKRNSCEFAAEDEIKKMFQTNAVDVLHNECPSIECESKKRKLTTNERSGNNDAAITMPPVMSELHSVSNVMQEESGNLQRKFNENGMPKDQQHSYQ